MVVYGVGLSLSLSHTHTRIIYSSCYFNLCAHAHAVNCGQPTPPNNVHLEMPNGTTEGSWILIKCNNGNNTTSAVCDSDGRWLPDPSQHYSNCESSTRVTVKGMCAGAHGPSAILMEPPVWILI